MTKDLWKLALVGIILLISSGCANFSTLQTARVEAPKKFKLTLGLGYHHLSNLPSTTSTVSAPYLNMMGRLGLAKDFDLGFRLTMVGTAAVDGKYQFLDAGKFAMAAGLSLGVLSYTAGSLLNATLPVYLSYDLSDSFALYGSTRYTIGFGASTQSIGSTTITGLNTTHYLGGSLGLKVGRKAGGLFEFSYDVPTSPALPHLMNFNAAFFIGFGHSSPQSSHSAKGH